MNKEGPVDLFQYSEEELLQEKVLTHYEILNLETHASSLEVKKAYRKTSLKYHPDKTGRGDDDYVFLAVKAAYDILLDPAKRQAYDSTNLPFDDAIPPKAEYTDEDFYETFGPVFTLNLRFDANLRPENSSGGSKKKKNKNGNIKPPTLGDVNTPIEEVMAFYDYWTRFDSWRDFSSVAAEELQMDNIDDAESRYEKRWLQNEVNKKAKQLKKKEMIRIQNLVERAMDCDPRVKRDKAARAAAKKAAASKAEEDKKLAAQRAVEEAAMAEQREKQEKERRVAEKLQREKEKKILRKAKQALRRSASASFESIETGERAWNDAYDMNQDVEVLCSTMNIDELRSFTENYDQVGDHVAALRMLQLRAEEIKKDQIQDQNSKKANGSMEKDSAPVKKAEKKPWTKDELSALAKAVKKYPPGGSSRWEQIALFVNNLCKQENPRSKEDCIDKYNTIARSASKDTNGNNDSIGNAPAPGSVPELTPETSAKTCNGDSKQDSTNCWTSEQDKQLQDGLAKFPGTMEKNERWNNIASGVSGKSKKECVERFKTIRESLKGRNGDK